MGREMLLNAQHVPQPGLLSHTHPAQHTITTTNEGGGWESVEQWKWDRKLAVYTCTVCAWCCYSLFQRLTLSHFCQYRLGAATDNYYHCWLFFSVIGLLYEMSENGEKLAIANFLQQFKTKRYLIYTDMKRQKMTHLRGWNQEMFTIFFAKWWLIDNCRLIVCWLTNQLNENSTNHFSQGRHFHKGHFIVSSDFCTIISLNIARHNPDVDKNINAIIWVALNYHSNHPNEQQWVTIWL